jgi:acyl-CoA dehydrogenase
MSLQKCFFALLGVSFPGGPSSSRDVGKGSVAAEYDVERKFRETRLYQIAPISTNLILSYIGEHVLGMSRSF